MKRYEQIPHTADLAARIYGANLEELYENAAYAMFDMCADIAASPPEIVLQIKVGGVDPEDLLICWLNELLYRAFSENMIFSGFKVDFLTENDLTATVKGFRSKGAKKEIKAATYHDLQIMRTDRGCEVTVVFDV